MKYRYFTEEEFRCPCGECEELKPSYSLLTLLDEARSVAGIPFKINSGVRCPAHNKEVGGVVGSEHVTGEGADIAISGSWERMKIVEALLMAGCLRIGVAKTFVHVGVSTDKARPVLWVY